MFRYEPAIIDSHFNFVGYASTLVKKGANESFAVTKYFRDISIEPIETIKEDQVDIDLGESSKCMYFDSLVPINLGFLCRTILTVPGGDSTDKCYRSCESYHSSQRSSC